jgi:hypothetical protein
MEAFDLVSCRIWSADEEQAAVNTLWFNVSSITGDGITDEEFAEYVDTQLGPLYKDILSQNAVYRGIEVQIIRGFLPTREIFASVLNSDNAGGGTLGTDSIPRQNCGLISLRTARAGQRYRGRIYLPFLSVVDITSEGEASVLYLAAADLVRTFIETFVDGDSIVGASGSALMVSVIYHRPVAGVEVIPNRTPVKEVILKTAIATQRRRGTLGKANKGPF